MFQFVECVVLVTRVTATGCVDVWCVPIALRCCTSWSFKPHQVTEYKVSSAGVRIHLKHLIGIVVVFQVLVWDTRFNGITDVVCNRSSTTVTVVHTSIQECSRFALSITNHVVQSVHRIRSWGTGWKLFH